MENENVIDQNFQEAVRNINNLNTRPTDDELLKLYGLYKQSLFGDNKTDKPGFFSFRGNKKWNSWMEHAGKSKQKAKKEYVSYAKEIIILLK
jgi:diazepam-binding inhibitor (GABA receptor modulating acyl-CoA-binding protein)